MHHTKDWKKKIKTILLENNSENSETSNLEIETLVISDNEN
jgi:hypothetical protein